MQPVQYHLAAWDAHTGKAFSCEEMAAACCVPALLPNLLSACRAGPGEPDCGSPARLIPMQGTEGAGGIRLLARRGNAPLHGYLAKGMHCDAVTPDSAWGLGWNPLPLAGSPVPREVQASPTSPGGGRGSLKRSLFEVALMEMGLFQRYSNGCLVICSQGCVSRR